MYISEFQRQEKYFHSELHNRLKDVPLHPQNNKDDLLAQ